MSFITIENIIKNYGDNTVLKSLNMEMEEGKLITLLGPSGCGKSTLLRSIAGLEEVSGGRILLNGKNITNTPAKDRNIGMVFQQYSLFPNMNIYDNVAFGLRMKKVDETTIKTKVMNALDMVDLVGREKSMPNKMSGGQQQRVALARAIVSEPKVLLLDEPLSAIDAKLRKSLQMEIRRIQQEMGITTIFVTHDQDEAMIMSDVIHVFNQGKIEQSGTPMEIYTNPKTPFVASFIGNYNILKAHQFNYLVGMDAIQSGEVALRPETVELYSGDKVDEEAYIFKAKISSYSNRGNVLRYTLEKDGIKIKSDALFRTKALHDVGEEVTVSIKKRNLIEFSGESENE